MHFDCIALLLVCLLFQPASSFAVRGFDYLRLLNLEDNCIADWNEILKLSQLRRLVTILCCFHYSNYFEIGEGVGLEQILGWS